MKILIISFILLFFFNFSIAVSSELTTEEYNKVVGFVEDVVENYPEEGVGQLFMINIPVNYMDSLHRYRPQTRKKPPLTKTLIEEHGFGSIILDDNNFRYMDGYSKLEEERIDLITSFVRNLQYRTISSKLKKMNKIPLFISSDFESHEFNSIGSYLTSPPPALTLASTKRLENFEDAGRIVGYQLTNSGINMLLGPVLDIDKSTQGNPNLTLLNRSFSSNGGNVSNIAGRYIKGLRESGVLVIGKHFPGMGAVLENPHFKTVSFDGSKEDLTEHTSPFLSLKHLLNGIMTSHVSIDFIDSSNTPATFSKRITGIIRSSENNYSKSGVSGIGFDEDKLIISDDFGMKAVTKYSGKKSYPSLVQEYSNLVKKAFDSNHDIIMFSKVVEDRFKSFKHGRIGVSDLISVKEEFTKYVLRTSNKKKYKDSLRRILLAKTKLYKLHGGNVNALLDGKINKVLTSKIPPPKSIKRDDSTTDLEKIKSRYKKILREGYLLLTPDKPPMNVFSESKKACFFSQSSFKDTYYEGLDIEYSNQGLKFNSTPYQYKDKKASIMIREIKDFLEKEKCDKVFFEISSYAVIDRVINIIDYLNTTTINEHLVLLLHISPTAITENIFKYDNLTVMGTFTSHPFSYEVDVEVMRDSDYFNSKRLSGLTIEYRGKESDEIFSDYPVEDIQVELPEFVNSKESLEQREQELKQKESILKTRRLEVNNLETTRMKALKNKFLRELEVMSSNLKSYEEKLHYKTKIEKSLASKIDRLEKGFSENTSLLVHSEGKYNNLLSSMDGAVQYIYNNLRKRYKGRDISFSLDKIHKDDPFISKLSAFFDGFDQYELDYYSLIDRVNETIIDMPDIEKVKFLSIVSLVINDESTYQTGYKKDYYDVVLMLQIIITGFIVLYLIMQRVFSTRSVSHKGFIMNFILLTPILVVVVIFMINVFLFLAHRNELPIHQYLQF